MLVWGGAAAGMGGIRQVTNTGASYDPVSNTWEDIPATEAKAREGHTAVWTGAEMIILGGYEVTSSDVSSEVSVYVPASHGGAWTLTKRAESVAIRDGHTAVWTGSEMLVFGGKFIGINARYRTQFNAVNAFNPADGSWRVVESDSAPANRTRHTAVWTGSSMIVWGGLLDTGSSSRPYSQGGGIYYP
jgi:N-acetylneuraminic acid mutarotase